MFGVWTWPNQCNILDLQCTHVNKEFGDQQVLKSDIWVTRVFHQLINAWHPLFGNEISCKSATSKICFSLLRLQESTLEGKNLHQKKKCFPFIVIYLQKGLVYRRVQEVTKVLIFCEKENLLYLSILLQGWTV